jgi:transposase-like protein
MRETQKLPNCPSCGSSLVVRNGHIHNGKAKFACKACQRQFVENPEWKPISDETKQLIEKLLLERLSLAAIARVCGVSKRWLQSYVNAKYAAVEGAVRVPAQKNGN